MSLVFEQAINDIIAAWSRIAQQKQRDLCCCLRMSFLVLFDDSSELSIQLFNSILSATTAWLITSHSQLVGYDVILNLDKMSCFWIFVGISILFLDLCLNKLATCSILLDRSQPEISSS